MSHPTLLSMKSRCIVLPFALFHFEAALTLWIFKNRPAVVSVRFQFICQALYSYNFLHKFVNLNLSIRSLIAGPLGKWEDTMLMVMKNLIQKLCRFCVQPPLSFL